MNHIAVRGAREHNLKNIAVDVPRDQLVVITGLSGSGKSSLAFDTIYAEGQRRYVESLSTYARQFLGQNAKPDVDSIDGLSPAIAIEQKNTSRNPRSTVGTLTEIYDYLRLLFARIGTPHCPQCGKPIESLTVQQICDHVLALPEQTRILVLAPVIRGRKGEFKKLFDQWRKDGFVRVRLNGEVHDLSDDIVLDRQKKHDIDLVVDRLVIKPRIKQQLTESLELALKRASGLVKIAPVGAPETLYSESFSCDDCGVSLPEIAPRLFSFNSPYGACQQCTGLGYALDFDVEKIIPDKSRSLIQGAIAAWPHHPESFYIQQLRCLTALHKQRMDVAWEKLSAPLQQLILYGSAGEALAFNYRRHDHSFRYKRPFEGVVASLMRRYKETKSERMREELEAYMTQQECPSCRGTRLRPEALAVRIAGNNLHAVTQWTLAQSSAFFRELILTPREQIVAARILKEVCERLHFLEAVGLDYLSLSRTAATLSGGEAQRIRLATQIGSALRGVIYVLDEPSIGLHQRDNDRLLSTLRRLRDLGNSVLVVEHDEETIRAADHIIDMGPGAGAHGGHVVAMGSVADIIASPASLTGAFLAGRESVAIPQQRRSGRGEAIWVRGARGNNLANIDVCFPLGQLVCVTGVSGSGKSTLVTDTLFMGLKHLLYGGHSAAAPHRSIEGAQHIDALVDIDQSPIGRTPRSNPATYTQLFAPIRELFAALPESRARGYSAGRYSFNVKGGRCEACEGDGLIRLEMHFLPDVFVTCEQCQGRRYNRETLEVFYKGKSIADILEMSVDEAANFLQAVPPVSKKLQTLQEVGLGYIKLGQSATTLSGGEAQRVKLSRELSRRATGRTLYILDEPTTGLHFHDVARLLHVLHTLVDAGNTVVVIEHNLDVIKTADTVIDLGPEGGAQGGKLLAFGTPEFLSEQPHSYTGQYLAKVLPPQAATHR